MRTVRGKAAVLILLLLQLSGETKRQLHESKHSHRLNTVDSAWAKKMVQMTESRLTATRQNTRVDTTAAEAAAVAAMSSPSSCQRVTVPTDNRI